MTAEAQAQQGADHAALPSLRLEARQIGDLELILSGAFAPLCGFMTRADVAAVAGKGTLAGGSPWPVPVTLEVPADAVGPEARQALLADPEGTPLAVLTITERTPLSNATAAIATPSATTATDQAPSGTPGRIMLAGPVRAHRVPEHGAFRRLMISPAQARAELGGGPVLAFATRAPISARQIGQLKHLAGQLNARLLVLPMVAGQAEVVRQPEALVRSVLAAARSLPAGTLVVPVPYAPRTGQAAPGSTSDSGDGGAASEPDLDEYSREIAAAAIIAAAYGATHLMADRWPESESVSAGQADSSSRLPGAPIPVLSSGDWAYDPSAEVWRPLSLIEAGTEIEDLTPDQIADMLDTGADIPSWFASEAVVAELRHARPPRSRRGFVLFLTGLSGSGKSTIARDLRDRLAERGDRRVSLLDGDQVRSLLSAGLTFSHADRDLNIARIGYVAAEIAKHGGVAICAPIAPYAAAREQVRAMVSEVGDFLLIYVATPVEVCEQRDRKGLYAKARAGLITQFTGVSDPYEEPADAALILDTSVISREQATEMIMTMLTSGGWLSADAGPREA